MKNPERLGGGGPPLKRVTLVTSQKLTAAAGGHLNTTESLVSHLIIHYKTDLQLLALCAKLFSLRS